MFVNLICGVDEAGRGPLAGPVYAAAVILGPDFDTEGLRDSKKLSETKRYSLAAHIKKNALAWSVGICSASEIDEINIHQATLLAMKRAIEGLNGYTSIKVMVDGLFCPQINFLCEAIVKGDDKVAEISAASIIAKTERDLKMIEIDKIYPGYQFKKHKGYPTKLHIAMIKSEGLCEYHRKSFSPIKEMLALQ
ncbi:ribonuclease HII [Candidatus Methylopumilus planktonicus]|jgi:ribonuclease HII|uniref:ribonuclease HII n=1 Tax=Candidatus Methylopumilus planktonicus TaxID=1581557 RepID=UPI0011214C12|nr:ribonuclease HII [Candidatus Methylopumilus planktonicus]QDD10934.1 ribonuclease HII [Candidatus Methylopumilus planktonicus]QDD23404.1 ribonuclease HII [Candidatus Methylopumilus planktonicus]